MPRFYQTYLQPLKQCGSLTHSKYCANSLWEQFQYEFYFREKYWRAGNDSSVKASSPAITSALLLAALFTFVFCALLAGRLLAQIRRLKHDECSSAACDANG